jgi:putrescine transport system ATP-binding protein
MIEDEPDHVLIESRELSAPIYVGHGISAAPNAEVWVAIRPEKIQLTRERPDTPNNCTPGVVKEIAYMGDMSILLMQLDSGKTVRVTQPNTYRHADDRLTWDERAWLSWHESSCVVVTQ